MKIIEMLFFGCYLLFICFIIHIFFKDTYNTAVPDINFYLATSVDNNLSNHSLYNITAFKKQDNITDDSFMIFLQPQNLYFFLENKGENLIYHPSDNNNSEKNFKCTDYNNFEIAYSFSIINNNNNKIKVICHRKLEYLKKIYTQRVFYKTFESLQNPIEAIKKFFIDNNYYYYIEREMIL